MGHQSLISPSSVNICRYAAALRSNFMGVGVYIIFCKLLGLILISQKAAIRKVFPF